MRSCWAEPLGDCGEGMSREHVVSASLWDGPAIQVVGFPWCRTEPKTVGVPSLTAKILCRRHNSSLSDVDAAGARAFKTLRKAALLQDQRSKRQPRKRWKVIPFLIDGSLLERWFLKTAINLGASNSTSGKWRLSGGSLDDPPLSLIEAALGIKSLQAPLGLYAVAKVGESIPSRSEVEVRTLLDPSDGLVGMLFTFVGFRFLLLLADGEVPLSALMPSSEGWLQSSLQYHIREINYRVGKKLSHRVRFSWS